MNIRERALSALQQDRLSEFNKVAREKESGCFQIALISAHNFLYPKTPLNKDFEAEVLKAKKLSVGNTDVLAQVKELEPYLKIKVTEIRIPYDIGMSTIDAREYSSATVGLFVKKVWRLRFGAKFGKFTEIAIVENEDGSKGHAIHAKRDMRVSDLSSSRGGQQVLDEYIIDGFQISSVIRLEKV